VNVERRGQRTLFVHAVSINARGKITLLNHFARGGVALESHKPSVMIGQRSDGAIGGVGLRWPDGLPRNGMSRLTEIVVIATPVTTDLSGLETRDLGDMRKDGTRLQSVLAQLCDGMCRGVTSSASALDGFFLKRLSFLLTPDD
jgi:hypothetical protein